MSSDETSLDRTLRRLTQLSNRPTLELETLRRILTPTSVSIPGPWLLDAEALKELDGTLETEIRRLRERYARDVLDARVNAALDRRATADADTVRRELAADLDNNGKRSIELRLAGGRRVTVETFEEATRLQDLDKERVVGFDLEFAWADMKGSVSLGGGFSGEPMAITVRPDTSPISQDIFPVLREWAMKHSAPAWQRAWLRHAGLQWPTWLLACMVATMLLAFQMDRRQTHTRAEAIAAQAQQRLQLIVSANELIKDGVSDSEVPRALETLLRLETGLPTREAPPATATAPPPVATPTPSGTTPATPSVPMDTVSPSTTQGPPPGVARRDQDTFPWSYKVLVVGGLVCCVALTIRPRLDIGIGLGRSTIWWWRQWLKAVATAPVWFFASFIWPQVKAVFPFIP